MFSKRSVAFAAILISSILCTLLIAATLTDSNNDPYADKTISSWNDVLTKYLAYRDSSYKLIPPNTEFDADTFLSA